MVRPLKFFMLIPALLIAGGCAIAPGVYMDKNRIIIPKAEDEAKFTAVPITVEVIAEQKKAEQAVERESSGAATPEKLTTYSYRVGPQDVLSFIVWDHPELTIPAGQYRSAEATGHLVGSEGTIFFPYIGEVKVAGLTVEEIRAKVVPLLKQYIRDPQVDVRVAAFRSKKVYVTGEVKKPGTIPVGDIPLTITDAITQSEGYTPEADLQRVRLTRGNTIHVIDLYALYDQGDVSQNWLLQNGDIINIPDRQMSKIYVMGEVMKPGVVLMNKGRMTLAESLGTAAGPNQATADAKRVFVIRGEENAAEPIVFHLDMNRPDSLLLATRFELKPLDVVFVSTADVARWNRAISQILPTVQALYYADIAIR